MKWTGQGITVGAVMTVCSVGALPAYAIAPLASDDSSVVDECRIETWLERDVGQQNYWFRPACNIAGFQVITAFARAGDHQPNMFEVAVKRSFSELTDTSIGTSFELSHFFDEGSSMKGDTYANFVASKSFFDGQFALHMNLGHVFREYETNDWTAGVIAEYAINDSQWLLLDVYRESAGRPSIMLGYILEVIPDRLELELGYGRALYNNGQGNNGQDREEFFSFGFAYHFKAF